MVHGGAGDYYAPNECVGIALITIVVQLSVLQKTTMQLPMHTNHSLNSFLRVGPLWSGVITLSRTLFMLVRPLTAKSRHRAGSSVK